ncbi:MAG: cytochrome [Tardiphaga sp.]|jgi:mono/diheme cytochrome c family protein|nr:cytochrome [Tardiphaga sp.]
MADVSIRSSELIPSPLPWRAPWGAAVLSALVVWLCFVSSAVLAQSAAHPSSEPTFSSGYKFTQMTGRDLFANICQGCHLPDGEGASGAGTYPSIARNKNLEASGYPVHVVVNGQRAMPPFGAMLSDDQVAAVVNYLRTNFGNDYRDAVTAADVKVVRP